MNFHWLCGCFVMVIFQNVRNSNDFKQKSQIIQKPHKYKENTKDSGYLWNIIQ